VGERDKGEELLPVSGMAIHASPGFRCFGELSLIPAAIAHGCHSRRQSTVFLLFCVAA
jgi:hypothetical protein